MTVLQKSTRRHRLIVAFLSVGSLLAVAACGGLRGPARRPRRPRITAGRVRDRRARKLIDSLNLVPARPTRCEAGPCSTASQT